MVDAFRKLLSLLPEGDVWKLFGLSVLMAFAGLFEVIGVSVIPAFVSIVANPEKILAVESLQPVLSVLAINNSRDLLEIGSILLIITFILKNIYVVCYRYIEAKFAWNRFSIIGGNLFQNYMNAPYSFHLNKNTSELLRNITQEARHLANNVLTPMLRMVAETVIVSCILLLLFWVEPINSLIVFVLLGGVGGLFLKLIRKKIREYGETAVEDRQMMIQSVNEGLGGFKEARVLKREPWFVKRLIKHMRSYSNSQAFRQVSEASTQPIIETVAVIGMMTITIILYLQGRAFGELVTTLSLFAVATVRLMPAIRTIVSQYNNLRYYVYTIYPLYEDTNTLKKLSNESQFKNTGSNKNKLKFNDVITLEDVSYFYPKTNKPTIKGLNLEILKGEVVGFVGSSGAGKSTLINLILGLLTPQSGAVYVDGQNINECLSAWQKNIGYIPQTIFLSDNTLKRNIAFGLPDEAIDEGKINRAIEAAQLGQVVDSLPDGINTMIGEQGIRLSGGQQQRIGIARALYHNPDLIIMDEGTSSLDNVTEKYVMQAIEKLRFEGDKTILIIAHRLTTVQNCDMLYFMSDGKIIDKGKYSDLIKHNDKFQEMALME